jgi:hypothetical protein
MKNLLFLLLFILFLTPNCFASFMSVEPVSSANIASNFPTYINSGVTFNGELIATTMNIISLNSSNLTVTNNLYTNSLFVTGNSVLVGSLTVPTINFTSGIGTNVTANYFYGDGSSLTSLNATELKSGTVPSARLSGTYPITVSTSNYSIDTGKINNYSVSLTSPTANQILIFNGDNWVNRDSNLISAGNGVYYYLDDSSSVVATYNALLASPNTLIAEDIDSVTCNSTTNGYYGGYITSQLGRTLIDAGQYDINLFAKVDNSTGISYFTFDFFRYTTTGNEVLLFSVNSQEINNTIELAFLGIQTTQTSFVCSATDRLLVKIYAKTDSVPDRTLSFTHNGTARYSNLKVPFITSHNDLSGLQGGAGTSFYHANQAIDTTSTPTFAGLNSPGIVTANKVTDGTASITGGVITSATNTNWDTAYTDRLKWDGGATGLTAATGRASLGLGDLSLQSSNNVTVSGGQITNTTIANATGSFTTASATTINATTAYNLNSVSINNSGTLTNVAYKGQDNAFTTGQTISGTVTCNAMVVSNNAVDGMHTISNIAGETKIQLNSNGTSYLNGGNVAFGKTTANQAVDVSGNVYASATVSSNAITDGVATITGGVATGLSSATSTTFVGTTLKASSASGLNLYEDGGTKGMQLGDGGKVVFTDGLQSTGYTTYPIDLSFSNAGTWFARMGNSSTDGPSGILFDTATTVNNILAVRNGAAYVLLVNGSGALEAPMLGTDTGTDLIINASNIICKKSSSSAYKDEITNLNAEIVVNDIYNLDPKRYKYKNTESYDYGLIAEQVEQYFPEIINYKNESVVDVNSGLVISSIKTNKIESYRMDGLVAIMLSAIKDQKTKIDDLEKRILLLEAKIN